MGKEVKIGLAVVGVLACVFSVMLFQYLTRHDKSEGSEVEPRVASQPLSSEGMDAKPSVVAAQPDSRPLRVADATPVAADVPRPSFMPADAPAESNVPGELAHDPADASQPLAGSPIAANDEPAQPRRNPLRRLSAELPLDPGQQPVEDTPTQELPVEDPAEAPAELDDGWDTPNDRAPAEMPVDEPDPVESPAEAAEVPEEEPPAREPADDRQWHAGTEETTPEPVAERPLRVENGQYTVQPGDTLWSISERVYGTGGYFKAIGAHNRSRLPQSDRLTVGQAIAVPAVEELEKLYPSLCPRQRKSALVKPRSQQSQPQPPERRSVGRDAYIVSEGDTLFDIARYELGKASRWNEIYELNRDILGEDFDYLRPGIELRLPPKAQSPETAGRGGDERYR